MRSLKFSRASEISPREPVATPPNTLAARRAIDAVYKLEPFKDFRGLYGHTVPKVHFNAKEACAKR